MLCTFIRLCGILLIVMVKGTDLTAADKITESIRLVRGQKILLDSDLALLYGVPTKRLNEQVSRNRGRFPADFIFRLSRDEMQTLNRSQIATGSQRYRDPRFLPYAFTEHGSIMAATILNSKRAVEMTIYVVRAFVQMRSILFANTELARQFTELERKVSTHDQAIVGILKAIRELMNPPVSRPIGFTANIDKEQVDVSAVRRSSPVPAPTS